jgi:hypothetical protein
VYAALTFDHCQTSSFLDNRIKSQVLIGFALLDTTGHVSGVVEDGAVHVEKATSTIEKLRRSSDVNIINALLDVLADAVDESTDSSERKSDLIEALEPTLIANPDIHLNTSLLQLAKSVLSLNGIATPDARDPLADRITTSYMDCL